MQPERNASDVRTDDDHVELETTLQELVLDLGGDAVETDVALGEHALRDLGLGSTDVGHVGGGGDVVVFNGVSGDSARRSRSRW